MSRRTAKKNATAPPTTIDVKAVADDELDDAAPPAEPETPADPETVPSCGWGGRLTPDEFFAFVPTYPHIKAVTFYVYRLEPAIDRTRTGGDDAESNIDKILGKPIDYTGLRNKWGSGKYHVRMKDTRFRPSTRQQVCDTLVEIDEYTAFPPIVDYRELVDTQKNASFIGGLIASKKMFRDSQGVLRVTPEPGTAANGTAGAGADGASIATKALDMAERALNRGSSKVEESAGVAAIQTMSTAFGTMLKTVMEGTGSKDTTTGPMLVGLFQMIQQQNATMLEIVRNQGNGANAGSGKSTIRELISEVTTLFEAAERMGFTRNGGEGQAPWWQNLVTALAPGLVTMIQKNAAGSPPAPGPSSPPAPRQPAPLTPAPVAPAGGIPATPAAAAAAEPAGAALQMPGPMTREELYALSSQVLKQLQRGISGYDFAKALDTMEDFATYTRIRTACKSGLVQEMMQAEPELIARFAPFLEQLQAFMEDFVSYGEDDDPGQPGDSPIMPAPNATAAAAR